MTPLAADADANSVRNASAEEARRAEALGRWRVQSRRIRTLRKALPAAMALLVLMLIGWIAARAVLTALNQARGAGAAIHMSDAVFHGRSETGKPFRLTAREAARDGVNPDQILLTAPIMEIAAGDGVGARRMTADNGVYHDNDKMLYMSGHVTVDDGQGTLFHSDRAVIDIDKDAAFGDTRVVGDGPQGHIEADSYRVDQKGRRVVFDGKVHGRFLPQKEQEQ